MPMNKEPFDDNALDGSRSVSRELIIVRTKIPVVRAAAANFYIILIPMYVIFAAFFPFPLGLRILIAAILILISIRLYLHFVSRIIVRHDELCFMNPITTMSIPISSIESVSVEVMSLLGLIRIKVKQQMKRSKPVFMLAPDIGLHDKVGSELVNLLKENAIMVQVKGGKYDEN